MTEHQKVREDLNLVTAPKILCALVPNYACFDVSKKAKFAAY